MERDDINRWQAKKIGAPRHPGLNYLFRLRQRMEKKPFPPNDPYYQMVCRAKDALHGLWIQTHYLSCTGVGRPSREEEEEGKPDEVV